MGHVYEKVSGKEFLPPSEYIEALLICESTFEGREEWVEAYALVFGDHVRNRIDAATNARYHELCSIFPEKMALRRLLKEAGSIVTNAVSGLEAIAQERLAYIASEHIRAAPDLIGRLSRYRTMVKSLRAAQRCWSEENVQPRGYTNAFLHQLKAGLRFAVVESADVED